MSLNRNIGQTLEHKNIQNLGPKAKIMQIIQPKVNARKTKLPDRTIQNRNQRKEK